MAVRYTRSKRSGGERSDRAVREKQTSDKNRKRASDMAKQLGGYKEEQEPPEQPDYVDTADVQRWCFLCLSAIHPGDFYAREAVKGMPPTHVRSYHVDCYEAMRAIRKNKYASCVF